MMSQEAVPILSWDDWKKMQSNTFMHQVQRGRTGVNAGLANGLSLINKYIYGTQRGRYYLFGGDSGTGKTTLMDFMFVINAWHSAKKKGVKIVIYYCSFEISKLDKEARWVSLYIYAQTGKCIPSDYILGRIPGVTLNEEDMLLVKSAYDSVQEIMRDIIFLEDAVHPTAVFESIITDHYEKHGEVKRSPVSEAEKKKGKKGRILGYNPRDPDMYTLLVIDHLGLTQSEMGLSLKGTIDKMSRYAVILRNMFQCTCVFIQQFSTDLLESKRSRIQNMTGKRKEAAVIPSRLDFGDSKAPYRDADVVFGIIKPSHFDLDEFAGIDTTKISMGGMGDYLTIMNLLKNRYGSANRTIPMFFNPIAGIAEEVPAEKEKSLDNSAHDGWYEKAKNLDNLCQLYFPKIG